MTAGRPGSADLITVPEAARLIGLHTDTLYRLCRTGQFDPAIQIGARWRSSCLGSSATSAAMPPESDLR